MKFKIGIQSRILTIFLEKAFSNGCYRLTFDDIARGVFKIKCPKDEHIQAIRGAWQSSQKQLRRVGMCAMLVSDVYFESYARLEPRSVEAIKMCIAGYGGCKAAGIRLLTMKGAINDPMALIYFSVRGRNVQGMMAAIADRATVEWKRGRLSKVKARGIVNRLTDIPLPEHQTDFLEMME